MNMPTEPSIELGHQFGRQFVSSFKYTILTVKMFTLYNQCQTSETIRFAALARPRKSQI